MHKSTRSIRAALFAMLATVAVAVVAPRAAHADASCEAMMAEHFNWDANGPAQLIRFQHIQYVYVKDSGAWTEFSQGSVYWNGSASGADSLSSLTPLTQLFSDRVTNNQPFAVGSPDQTTITGISKEGVVTMHNNTWNFDSTFNTTCVGNTMTARNGSDGTLLITLDDASISRIIIR